MSRAIGYPCRPREVLRRARAPGFTLLELLVVIAVVMTLFALSLGLARAASERTAIARANADLALLATALEEFKRHYGDYPPTTGASNMADANALFRALTGTPAPSSAGGEALRGPRFVDLSTFSLARPLSELSTATWAGSSDNAFVDPWGTPYHYLYKPAGGAWLSPGPVLFSAGPDGRVSAWPNASGVFTGGTRHGDANADNLYADQLLQ